MTNLIWHKIRMTSNASPSPFVVSSIDAKVGGEAFRAFDQSNGTAWESRALRAGWLQIDFGTQIHVNKLKLTFLANNTSNFPLNFKLKGKNTGGSFVDLLTVTNNTNKEQIQEFSFENMDKYSTYRLDISAMTNNVTIYIAEMVLGSELPINKTFILHDSDYKKYVDEKYYITDNTKQNPIYSTCQRYYPMKQNSGNTIESDRNNITGTINGSPTLQGDDGILFNGVDSYISFSNKILPLGAKSIFFQIKAESSNGQIGTIVGEALSTINHGTIVLLTGAGNINFNSQKAISGQNRFNVNSKKNVTDGNWHNVLLTWDGTTNANTVKIYIDDLVTPDVTTTANLTETASSSYNTFLGRSPGSSVNFLQGNIRNLEIYNSALKFNSNDDVYDFYIEKGWQYVSDVLQTSQQFLNKGMNNLSPLFDRTVTELEPLPMTDKSEILGVGEIGKVFSKTIDLKKYFDIRSIRTEVK